MAQTAAEIMNVVSANIGSTRLAIVALPVIGLMSVECRPESTSEAVSVLCRPQLTSESDVGVVSVWADVRLRHLCCPIEY